MKILVTGGNGFIGSNFIKYLFDNHDDIIDHIYNVDCKTYAATNPNQYLKRNKKYSEHNIKLGNTTISKLLSLGKLIKESDYVIHFAAESSVDKSIENGYAFMQTNIMGTYDIAHQCLQHNKLFHYVSTDEVFGDIRPGDIPQKFGYSSEMKPNNPYSASKASGEHIVWALRKTHGLKVAITNCSNNYGPHQHSEKFLPTVIKNLLLDQPIPIYGNGKNQRDWLFVEDHCKFLTRIMFRYLEDYSKISNWRRILIGGGSCITNLELVERTAKVLGVVPKLNFVRDRLGHDLKYDVSEYCLETFLKEDFIEKTKLEDGLKITCDFYKEYLNIRSN